MGAFAVGIVIGAALGVLATLAWIAWRGEDDD